MSKNQTDHAAETGRLDLSRNQITYLQQTGLLAEADEPWYPADESFVLRPRTDEHPDAREADRKPAGHSWNRQEKSGRRMRENFVTVQRFRAAA